MKDPVSQSTMIQAVNGKPGPLTAKHPKSDLHAVGKCLQVDDAAFADQLQGFGVFD